MDLPGFLTTDESLEAVAALEMVGETLQGAHEDPYRWKWAIIALHSALQGFMVLALRGTNGYHVLSRDAAKAYREAHQAGKPIPGEKLDSCLGLYNKIKSERMLMWDASQRFRPNGTQTDSVKKLNSLRNHFIHFLPQGYALQVAMLPGIFDDCLDVIDFLAWSSNNIRWYDLELETRSKDAMAAARTQLAKLAGRHA